LKKRVNHKSGEFLDAESRFAGDRQFAVALHRGLEVLQAIPAGATRDARAIARQTGLPRAAVARLTDTLCKLGYLDSVEGGFRLGIGLLGLGYGCLIGTRIVGAIQPFMDELAAQLGEGILVGLGRQDGLGMVYLACTANAGLVTVQMSAGARISLARSSLGHAFLAGLPKDRRDALLARIKADRGPDRWPEVKSAMDEAWTQIERQGFCASLGGWKRDVHSVAVPFNLGLADIPPLAFNCGGPAYLLPPDRLIGDVGPQLRAMAHKVAALCKG
jgi:DNA-binding IclR family transcriptional regulator